MARDECAPCSRHAHIGAAERRSRCPGGPDEFGDGQPRTDDLRLQLRWTPSWTALVSIAAFGALHLVRRSFSSFPSRELFTATLATVVVIWLAFAVLTFLRRGPVNRLVGLALLATALSPAGLATFDYLQALILESLDVQTTGRPFARLKLWLWGPAP